MHLIKKKNQNASIFAKVTSNLLDFPSSEKKINISKFTSIGET